MSNQRNGAHSQVSDCRLTKLLKFMTKRLIIQITPHIKEKKWTDVQQYCNKIYSIMGFCITMQSVHAKKCFNGVATAGVAAESTLIRRLCWSCLPHPFVSGGALFCFSSAVPLSAFCNRQSNTIRSNINSAKSRIHRTNLIPPPPPA